MQNRVIGNVLSDNRAADMIVASAGTDVSTLGNCFADNTFTTTAPNNLETLAPCDATGSGDWTDGEYNVAAWLGEAAPAVGGLEDVAELPALRAAGEHARRSNRAGASRPPMPQDDRPRRHHRAVEARLTSARRVAEMSRLAHRRHRR